MKITINLKKDENIKFYNAEQVQIELEDYIAGCVAQEIGNADLEACCAQAIAARTNVYPYLKQNKPITDQSSSFQAFTASKISYPYPAQSALITQGLVLTYNGKIAYPASFSANNGGKTTSSKERWGSERMWLIAQDDPYDEGKKTGHGVGMSQRGIKKMAELGFCYEDILSFYYPNTKIGKINDQKGLVIPLSDVNAVKLWALSKKGCGYIWGATGQTLTEKSLQQLMARYPSHINEQVARRWLGKQVFDCASFVRLAMSQVGIKMVSGASSQWKSDIWEEKGTIDTLPRDKVCCLYRASANANPMQHTGVYLGDGYEIDARGTKSGVVYGKISAYPWTHWAIPKGLYQNQGSEDIKQVLFQGKIVANSGSTVNMRASASTSSAKIVAMPIGSTVDVTKELDGWYEIIYNGKSGYVMSKFCEKIQTSDAQVNQEKNWYVRVQCGSKTEAEQLVAALQAVAKATAVEL